MAEYLADFDYVDQAFEFSGCPYLFQPENTDEEHLQIKVWMRRERKATCRGG